MGLKDQCGNALGLAQGVTTASTAVNALQNNPNAAYSGHQNIAYMQAQAVKDEPPKVNLNEGAGSIPISQLVALWVVKFGSKWVDHEEIAADEFYRIASLRLEKMGKMETHYLQDRYMPVYRIVE
jgi:hypothetical protein